MNVFINIFILIQLVNGFLVLNPKHTSITKLYDIKRKYPITRYIAPRLLNNTNNQYNPIIKRQFFNGFNKREIVENIDLDDTERTSNIIENALKRYNETNHIFVNNNEPEEQSSEREPPKGNLRIIINRGFIVPVTDSFENDDESTSDIESNMFPSEKESHSRWNKFMNKKNSVKKSENFEIIAKSPYTFQDIGGYENIKMELRQCIDILTNYSKYSKYNVRTPKGLIFEGSPGNGKTLIAKALAGEAGVGFIAVSGSEFQDKYVGVGASRIRELFTLAKKNIPCIIFVDEIDALGRKRSSDGESSGNERDSTLNELLVALDGFKNTSGVFLIGATNRADLLDPALIRPGRIDKRIFIDNPDQITRKAILEIHSKGKPYDESISIDHLVDVTNGFSGAQIENLLNEAMLHALRYDKTCFSMSDIDNVMNKIMVGWQPNEHEFTEELIEQIAIHELGHAVVGLFCRHHPKMSKVIINLSAPKSPAYTIFESSQSAISTREALFEHLMILLAGRIAEEIFYGTSVTTGAINDFEEAYKLAEKMIIYYGMGEKLIYPSISEKYKEIIDNEVVGLIETAYNYSYEIINNSKEFIYEGAEILIRDKILLSEQLIDMMNMNYTDIIINMVDIIL
jgi:cell division protease FtsH